MSVFVAICVFVFVFVSSIHIYLFAQSKSNYIYILYLYTLQIVVQLGLQKYLQVSMVTSFFRQVYTIKVETIENNSHPKWTTLTPHRLPHTAGPKMVDKWKQLFLKWFHSKTPTFLTIALLCTHRTHLWISYGKPKQLAYATFNHACPLSFVISSPLISLLFSSLIKIFPCNSNLIFPNLHTESANLIRS